MPILMTITFAKCWSLWALFSFVPVLASVVSGGTVTADQSVVLFLLFALPLLGTILLHVWAGELKSVLACVLSGLALRLAIPVVGGFLLFLATGGFERVAVIPGARMLSIPRAAGGAFAGFIYGYSNFPNRKQGQLPAR
jgi:hypothetical protein